MQSILPKNSTPFELAAEAAGARRLAGIDPGVVKKLFDPKSCPLSVLTWLAWSFGVEDWKNGMTEAEQRAAVAAAIETMMHRGTVGAVLNALAALGYNARIIEHRGTFTFDVETDVGPGVFAQDYATALRVIAKAKNVRSHLGRFSAVASREGRIAARAVCYDAEIITISS